MLATPARLLLLPSGLCLSSMRATMLTVAQERRAKRLRAEQARRDQENHIYFLTHMSPDMSGLPMSIYIIPKLGRAENDEPHVKVMCQYGLRTTGPWFSMTVDDKPRALGNPRGLKASDLELVRRFLALNKGLLLDYWHGEVDTDEALSRIRQVGPTGATPA